MDKEQLILAIKNNLQLSYEETKAQAQNAGVPLELFEQVWSVAHPNSQKKLSKEELIEYANSRIKRLHGPRGSAGADYYTLKKMAEDGGMPREEFEKAWRQIVITMFIWMFINMLVMLSIGLVGAFLILLFSGINIFNKNILTKGIPIYDACSKYEISDCESHPECRRIKEYNSFGDATIKGCESIPENILAENKIILELCNKSGGILVGDDPSYPECFCGYGDSSLFVPHRGCVTGEIICNEIGGSWVVDDKEKDNLGNSTDKCIKGGEKIDMQDAKNTISKRGQ